MIEKTPAQLKQLVRLNCGATGVDIGHGYGLFVCAQDNDLSIDKINTSPDADPPWPGTENVGLARMIVSYFKYIDKQVTRQDES